jgi:hypothetical protein
MESKTLEQYFLQDYEVVKDENERLKNRLRKLEDGGHDFGITDLHRKFQAVRGSTCSRWVIRDYLLKNGKMTPEKMREVMALDDETLFVKFRDRTLGYYEAIKYEEHEFQYTLYVKESRDEWTAVTDGKINSGLLKITDREEEEDLCEDEWYPIWEAEYVKEFLAQNLRKLMEEALDEYEREQREKEKDGDEGDQQGDAS